MPSTEHDAVVQLLRSMPAADDLTVGEQRERMEAFFRSWQPPADVSVEPITCDGVPAEWVAVDGGDPDRAIVYLHGGGYCIGSPTTHRPLCSALSREAGVPVLSVDYRLAPEHPHPAAVDDAVAAFAWLLGTGVTPDGVAIAGDSAGGGLAIAALIAIRDRRLPAPGCGVALSPWVDLEGIGESMTSRAELDPMVQAAGLKVMADRYLAGQDARTPLAAPLYADLHDLPPLLVQVGGAETLYDDSTRIVERARASGVDVTFEPYDGCIHVFQAFVDLPEAKEAIASIARFVNDHTA